MIQKIFVSLVYLWLIFISLANGQYFGDAPFGPSQPFGSPLNQPYGSQNSFSPGPQPTGFNLNPQGINPQNAPQIPDRSFPSQGFRNPQFPDLGSFEAIFIPDKLNQPAIPTPQNPVPYNPPFTPQNPSSSFTNPQPINSFNPDFQGPSSIFNSPQQNNPLNPGFQGPSSIFNNPQPTDPLNPSVQGPSSIFTNPPQTNPFFTPQQNRFIPDQVIPYNPPGTNPFNNPAIQPFASDQTIPFNPSETSPFKSPQTNPFNPTALLSALPLSSGPSWWKSRPFHPYSVAPQQDNPSYTRPQENIQTFSVPQQTNPDIVNPQQTNSDLNGFGQIQSDTTNPQQTDSDLTRSQQTNPDITSSQQTTSDLAGSQQTNPAAAGPPQTNTDSISSQQTNPDTPGPQQSNSDLIGFQQTNPNTAGPQQTNSDLTDSQQTNPDIRGPPQTNSNPTDLQQTNSDTTGLQQAESESASPPKVDPTSDDNPMTLASELSSTVSNAPQDAKPSVALPYRPAGQRPNRKRRPRLFHPGDDLKGMRIVCLFNNKHFYKTGFTPARLDPSLCTHLNYEFAILDPQTYEMIIGAPDLDVDMNFYQEAIHLKHFNRDLKVLVSLGGWADSTKKYSELADDPAKRKNFINKAIEFLQKHGFDGLDLAWEYPNCWEGAIGVSPKDKPNFVTFLKEIKNAFKPKGLLLSVSVGAVKREVDAAYDVPEVSNNVDYINVMTYDMHGPWEKKTSHHVQFEAIPGDTDPYCNVKGGMQVWIEKGAHKKKLNMGLAFYGRTFRLADPSQCGMGVAAIGPGAPGPKTQEGGLLSYNEICQYLNSGNWTEKEDKHAGFYACSGDQFAGYDPPPMMVRKAKYVAESGMGGVLVKDLSGDDFEEKCFSMPFPLLTMVKLELIHAMHHPHSTRHH